MIVVFTSNEKGGLIQMAVKVTEKLLSIGIDARCFMPSIATGSISDDVKRLVIRYTKRKSINPFNSTVKSIAKQIMNLKPELVWYIDNGVFSSQVAINLTGNTKQALVMHDAGTNHSSYNSSLKLRLKRFVEKKTSEICNNKIDWIITCSPNSRTVYSKLYPSHSKKVYMLPLGPHMPVESSKCPPEIKNASDYYLFFGRIDRYKGVDVLLRSYSLWPGKRKLIIAGNGQLRPDEIKMAESDTRIILINRFIKDEEMPYLFTNARAVVLPYKDATQSGILPIAYMYGKPVISSEVIGIAQFVENGKTGYVCSSFDSYICAYNNLEKDGTLKQMSQNARHYYEENLEWQKNICHMLKEFGVLK